MHMGQFSMTISAVAGSNLSGNQHYEISARWGCPAADIAGWAAAGHLQVLAGIPPVTCGGESIAGMVEVPIAELMPMFRRFGPSDEHGRLKRVKPLGSSTWLNVTEPPDGLPIRSSDLLLAAGQLSAATVTAIRSAVDSVASGATNAAINRVGIAIMLTCLSSNLVGDWLRDLLDPKRRQL